MYTKFLCMICTISFIPSKQDVSHVTHAIVVVEFGACVPAQPVPLSAVTLLLNNHVWMRNKHISLLWMRWKLRAAKKTDFKPRSQTAIKDNEILIEKVYQ